MSKVSMRPTLGTSELVEQSELSDDARALLHNQDSPIHLWNLLVERRLNEDALRLGAHLLSPREAVWWGCLCVWHVTRTESLDANHHAGLHCVISWVEKPTEQHRLALKASGETLGIDSPIGALAMAAFWSAGSMTPPDLPEVEPPPFLTAKTVVAALLSASTQPGPDRLEQTRHEFALLGSEVIAQVNLWRKE